MPTEKSYRRTLLIITFNGCGDRVVRVIKRLGLKATTVIPVGKTALPPYAQSEILRYVINT